MEVFIGILVVVGVFYIAMLCMAICHPKEFMEMEKAHKRQHQAIWASSDTKKKGGGIGKLVVIVLAAAYIICPIDLIPDVIPVLGWGDDVVAGLIGLRALIK